MEGRKQADGWKVRTVGRGMTYMGNEWMEGQDSVWIPEKRDGWEQGIGA